MDYDLGALLDKRFSFKRRPVPILADMRAAWRLPVTLLILACSRRNRASLTKLHVVGHALRRRETQRTLYDVLHGDLPPGALEVRVEPALGRALDYGLGEGLLRRVTGKTFELSSGGVVYVERISQDEDLLAAEKEFLNKIQSLATESRILGVTRLRKGR